MKSNGGLIFSYANEDVIPACGAFQKTRRIKISPHPTVIPAKAGIQGGCGVLDSGPSPG